MTGSGIFAAGGEDEEDESGNASATPVRTAPKNYQVPISVILQRPVQIDFRNAVAIEVRFIFFCSDVVLN
jgi:hypothetical protein